MAALRWALDCETAALLTVNEAAFVAVYTLLSVDY